MNYIFLLPFAFGGNPACESGPRAAYNIIMDNFSPQKYSIFIIEQKINESPENYLLKVEGIFDKEVVDNSKCCVIGGNHLSILPVYKHIIKSNLLSNFLILDAHRDFYPQNDLSHSTFLKYISHDNNFLLVGCRDKNKHHSFIRNTKVIFKEDYKELLQINMKKINMIDIDLDVIDESEFTSYSDYIPNGLSLNQIREIILLSKNRGAQFLSISEYNPIFDYGQKDLLKIIDLINLFFDNYK